VVQIATFRIMLCLVSVLFSYVQCLYAESHYAECCYCECHYGECCYVECSGTMGSYILKECLKLVPKCYLTLNILHDTAKS
jgi:hypothetical protein